MSDYPEDAARFKRETASHEMRILQDNSLYRHLMFWNPQNRGDLYRFDLITWPNNLAIRGDGPNFMFSVYPTADLFDLFKGSSHNGINPGYWQEKVVAGQVMSWSEEKFRTWLVGEAAAHEARYPGLLDAVGKQILHSDEHSTEYRGTAEYAVASFSHGDYRLRFPDPWEESFEDFSWEFLWACHAVVWGIARYDAARKAVAR